MMCKTCSSITCNLMSLFRARSSVNRIVYLSILMLLISISCFGCNPKSKTKTNKAGDSKATKKDLADPKATANKKDLATQSGIATDKEQSPIKFDWMKETGVSFIHRSGNSAERPFPAANGSGVALLDYDRDGLLDLYCASGTDFPIDPENRKYFDQIYRQNDSWKFSDTTNPTRLGHHGYTAGVTVADFNNDGFDDIYLGCYGENILYQNQGDGTFEIVEDHGAIGRPAAYENEPVIKVTEGPNTKSFLASSFPGWATSVLFVDYNMDGNLDIYVCNYGLWTMETNKVCGNSNQDFRRFCGPETISSQRDVLYESQGDGTFVDVSAIAEINPVSPELREGTGRGQGVIAADVNNDGLIDLYVGNDLTANMLLINNGDGTFRDESQLSSTHFDRNGSAQASMGVDAIDINGDGFTEIFVTNFQNEHNAFYESATDGIFNDNSNRFGLAAANRPWVGWGTSFQDFDLDGLLDVIVVNGHVDDNLIKAGQTSPYDQPAIIWQNTGKRFKNFGSSCGEYFKVGHPSRGLAVGDIDNDGDVDMVTGNQDTSPGLLKNLANDNGETKDYFVLHLIGKESNRNAIGTRVEVIDGGETRYFQVRSGGSYLSSHDYRLVFKTATDTSATIKWPSGKTSKVSCKPQTELTLVEPMN